MTRAMEVGVDTAATSPGPYRTPWWGCGRLSMNDGHTPAVGADGAGVVA
ncbi:hypothetical protein ACWDA3_32140 [Nonomuraea rubra]